LAVGAAAAQTPPPPGAPGPPPNGAPSDLPFSDEEVIRTLLPPLPANAPKPSTSPRDFEGTWTHNQVTETPIQRDMYGTPLPFTPVGRKIRDRRSSGTPEGVPYANASAECRPMGQPWALDMFYAFQVYQTPSTVSFILAYGHAVWHIRLNQPHRATREYMGDSVGHWEGDTLVVDTINYKQGLWIDSHGTPASRNAHLVQRIRKIDHNGPMLEIVTTVDDPSMYTAKWSVVRTFAWRPDRAIFPEYDCENQAGQPDSIERYGLVPEPKDDL
jgi:hypothetical protein